LEQLIEAYGSHALTLDHLGGLIGQFLGGDPTRAPEVASLSTPGDDRQALRLARLLRAYEKHLAAEELALLSRLCVVRRSLTRAQIQQLFLCLPEVHARTVRTVREFFKGCIRASTHMFFARNMAESIQETLEEALAAAPLAGPEH